MTQLLVLLDQPFHRKKLQNSSFFFFCSFCFPELALVFPNENFHVHMRTLTAAFSSFFRRGFPLLSPWCYQKMHYFCLAAKNDFLSLHLHFWLFSLRFSLELFRLFNKPLFFFFCETSGLLNRFDELLKKRRRMYTGSEIPFRSTTARLF